MHALHVPTERGGRACRGGGGGVVSNCKMYFLPPQKGKPKLTAKKNKGKKFEQQKLTQQLQPVA